MDSLKAHVIGVSTDQEWTSDPAMVQVTIPASFFEEAERAMEFLQNSNFSYVGGMGAFDYETFMDSDQDSPEGGVEVSGVMYEPFEPEYELDSCTALLYANGAIQCEVLFAHSNDRMWFELGNLDELKAKFDAAQQEEQNTKPKMGM